MERTQRKKENLRIEIKERMDSEVRSTLSHAHSMLHILSLSIDRRNAGMKISRMVQVVLQMRTDQAPSGGVRGRQADTQTAGRRDARLRRLLTGNGAQVQVVPDHLLELMVQGTLLKLQAEVVTQIGIQHLT